LDTGVRVRQFQTYLRTDPSALYLEYLHK